MYAHARQEMLFRALRRPFFDASSASSGCAVFPPGYRSPPYKGGAGGRESLGVHTRCIAASTVGSSQRPDLPKFPRDHLGDLKFHLIGYVAAVAARRGREREDDDAMQPQQTHPLCIMPPSYSSTLARLLTWHCSSSCTGDREDEVSTW